MSGDGTRTNPRGLLAATFASLYAIQGIVIAYFFNFNQKYMLSAGLSPGTIGTVQSIALIPLILRFLGGPLSDRFDLLGLGHRRPYIVLGLTLQGAGLLGLSLVNPAHALQAFTAIAVVTVIGLALYDTAADGFILDSIPHDRRPRVQGMLVAARFLGATMTSVGFGYWLERTGTGPGRGDGVLWTCAGLGLVPMILTLFTRERPRSSDEEGFRWEALRALIRPRAIILLFYGTLYAIVAYAVEINLSTYYDHLGFGSQAVGDFAATRYIGRAIGAAMLGLASRRMGRMGILAAGIVLLAAGSAGQALVDGRPGAFAMALVFGLANGWNDALFYVLAMEASDPRMAASTCALFMSVTNLSVLGGGIFSRAVELLDGRYPPAFLGAGVIVSTALFLVPILGRRPLTAAPRPESSDASSVAS